MHKPIHLVNPIVKIQVFCRFSIFIGSLFQSSGKPIRAMLSTGDVDKSEVE